MDAEKDKILCERYPNLYRDRNRSSRETCMCWGFTCGDGWYSLIDELSAKLEAEIVKMKQEGVTGDDLPAAAQAKEKFGLLRFYMTHATEQMYDMIAEAETKSGTICEDCGEPGQLRPGGWIRTLCDGCAE